MFSRINDGFLAKADAGYVLVVMRCIGDKGERNPDSIWLMSRPLLSRAPRGRVHSLYSVFSFKKGTDMDADLFREAVDIAHGEFWLADCPTVRVAVKETIEKREKYTGLDGDPQKLSRYVAIICHEAAKSEIRQMESSTA